MDYYKILGIKKNATTDKVKKAFRSLTIKNHPDNGGDVEFWYKIKKAYDNLVNPKKRLFYDMNGKTEDEFKVIIELAVSLFKEGIAYDNDNIQDGINSVTTDKINNLNKSKDNCHSLILEYNGLIRRIKKAPDNNFIKGVLEKEILAFQTEITQINIKIENLNSALELLEEYSFSDIPGWIPNRMVSFHGGVQRI